MLTRLFLIRHGITDWNKQNRYCGCKDIGLSRQGKKQAGQLRKNLKNAHFDVIYASDRKRAVQTARIIFGRAGIIKIKGLREINFGALEGLTYAQAMKKWPVKYRKWLDNPFKSYMPGTERMNSFKNRVNAAMKRIVRLNSGKTIAVICHGGTISVFIAGILKKKDFWSYIPGAAGMAIVEYQNE